jgi:hypothetical protein
MKYSNRPIETVAVPTVIDFGSSSETSKPTPGKLHLTTVNNRLLSGNSAVSRPTFTLNRPTARANRALSEFARGTFG